MSSQDQQHPGADELSAYVAGSLTKPDRARLEAHLASCDDCRADVVEVLRLFRPAVRRRMWYVAAGLSAAVLAGVLVFAPQLRDESAPAGPVLRAPEVVPSEALPAVTVLRPQDASVLRRDDLDFAWRAAALEASYRLTVTDDVGDVVWTVSTADTLASFPRDSVLQNDQTYFWYVDALLPDGRSTTSGVHEFRTSR